MRTTEPAPEPPPAHRADPPRASTTLGRDGEDLAVRYLLDRGMEVIERNWRCEHGEVDIVAVDGDYLVICEVKTRRGLDFGPPAEAVTPAKVKRLRTLGLRWLADHGHPYTPLRFDVVSVVANPRGPAAVEHLRGAF